MKVTTPKAVTKVITDKVIRPLVRSDMSVPKKSKKEIEPQATLEDLDEEVGLQEDTVEPLVTEEPIKKKPVKTKPAQAPVVEEVLDIEADLAFLNEGRRQIENDFVVSDLAVSDTTAQEELGINPVEEVKPERIQSFVNTKKITLNLDNKINSCYFPSLVAIYPEDANIFLQEVNPDTELYQDIVQRHKKDAQICLASPFKFFSKVNFVKIFQKAFLGQIFDLAYATPYYQSPQGKHQIYLSSHIVNAARMLHVVLLDVLDAQTEQLQIIQKPSFVIHRILLVSANALYL